MRGEEWESEGWARAGTSQPVGVTGAMSGVDLHTCGPEKKRGWLCNL